MPLNIGTTKHPAPPNPEYLTLNNWKRGVITLIDKSRLPKDALEEATNIFLYEDGQPGPRPGVDWYGNPPGEVSGPSFSLSPSGSTSPSASLSPSHSLSPSPSSSLSPSRSLSPSASVSASLSPSSSLSPSRSLSPSSSTSSSPSSSLSPSHSLSPSASASSSPSPGDFSQIDGFDYFDFNGVIHLVAASGGTIYRSTDDAVTWTPCTGASYTPGNSVNMNQYNSYLYLTSGVDSIILYNGTTTLTTYTALPTPTAPVVAQSGLGTTTIQYLYKVAAVNTVGFSSASAVGTGVTKFTTTRDAWSSTAFATITIPATSGAIRYDIYISEDDLNYYYLDSATPATTGATVDYRDDGTAIPIPSTTAPTDNTTQGPLVEELTNVGSRMYGVRDTAHRYRIWFTSGGYPFGAFSNSYDGGYLDWQIGGKFIPVKVVDYRDGKGTPLATVFCKSADGQGCVIQMSLDVLTVGDISITVPSAYKLPGSRGTPAPSSVVNVLNDFMFYNSQAFYNLGSRPQFLNLLSTDESSANIRPTVRQISSDGESNIASTYFDARVYFSVPYGASENNYTAVYDTERRAWLPKAFTLGFTKFLRYTDTNGARKLLALKSGDDRLSEISANISGDYGEAFETSLNTGLYPITKDRFEFQFTEEGEIELSNPIGRVNTEILGVERVEGYSSIATKPIEITSMSSSVGWNTFAWNTTAWNDTSVVSEVFSESSIKRYLLVQKELNAVQWRITTNTRDARYVLRTLQTWGTSTQSGHPPEWLLS